ncbi:VOC family protein [Sphaerimonospora cavernae]|uniref:VOC family protein n=1 Tax=Sphaerimonospora cavernae TaxID=1740611 RepID=A0ABV6U2S8_9ACTN
MTLIHHVGLTVSDLERSLDFYIRLLGMSHLGTFERSGPQVDAVTGYPGVVVRQAFARPLRADCVVELLQYVGGNPDPIDPENGRVGAVHVAVEVAELDRTLDRLREEGVIALSDPIVAGVGPMAGCRVVYVLDPDRVRVELVEPPTATPTQAS